MTKNIQELREIALNYDQAPKSLKQDLFELLTGAELRHTISELRMMSDHELNEAGYQKPVRSKIRAIFGLYSCMSEERVFNLTVRSPDDAGEFLVEKYGYLQQEHFVVLLLNTKNKVIAEKVIFVGSLNASIVHPREVMAFAVKNHAASVIICHNHPSNLCQPSPEDLGVTKRLVDAGELLGIDIIDHIIVGHDNFVSLKEKGYM